MKKLSSALPLAFILSLLLFPMGCAPHSTEPNPAESTENIVAAPAPTPQNSGDDTANQISIRAGETVFTATLADNSSAQALKDLLRASPLTVDLHDYNNMEKVGTLGTTLPENDERITTEPGDLILYQGNSLCIYYDTNTWDFTRLGKINDVTQAELKQALGEGDISVTLELLIPQ